MMHAPNRLVISHRTLGALRWEVANLQRFLDRFEPLLSGQRRKAALGETGEFIVVQNFPLPDGFQPDYIQLLVLVPDYPARPPCGLYCLNAGNERIITQIQRVFHVYRDKAFYTAPSVPGYTWICHHYAGNQWRHVPHAPNRGDNVAKYLADFHFKLEEGLSP